MTRCGAARVCCLQIKLSVNKITKTCVIRRQRAKGSPMCLAVRYETRDTSPCNVSLDILRRYWRRLQSDPALLQPDSHALPHSFLHFGPYYLFQSLKVSLSRPRSLLLLHLLFFFFFLGCLPLKMTMRLARALPKE